LGTGDSAAREFRSRRKAAVSGGASEPPVESYKRAQLWRADPQALSPARTVGYKRAAMDELLRRLDPAGEEDEAYPRLLRSFVEGPPDGERLRLDLELVFGYQDLTEVWSVTCAAPRRWQLGREDFEPVALAGEHPLL